jgi:lysophospholipase L1-like esterase
MLRLVLVLSFVTGALSAALAADQEILGTSLVVTNPGPPERRKVVVKASEPASPNTIVGDPVASGAMIMVRLNGTTGTAQLYNLPNGVSQARGRPFWTGDAASGFSYRDSRGENGPVWRAQIRLQRGTFRMKLSISGRTRPVTIVPPNDGTDGCVWFAIGDGDSYSVKFADGAVFNSGASRFKVTRPILQGPCQGPPTTTTTSSTTTSSSTTTTSATSPTSTSDVPGSTTTTTSTVPTTTTLDTRPVVWLFGDSNIGFVCPIVRDEHPEWNVSCRGVSGESTTNGLLRLQTALADATVAPTVVLVFEGVNDALYWSDRYDTSSGTLVCDMGAATMAGTNLQAMADAVRERGGTPLLTTTMYNCPVIGVPCMNAPVDDPTFCPNLRCLFDGACLVSQLVKDGPTPWVSFVLVQGQFMDLLHPNAAGSAVLAQRAADAIAAALGSASTTTTTTLP